MEENQSRLIDVIDDMCQAKNALFHMVRNARDIMSCNVKTLTLDDTINTCLEIMTENNIRHIPILDISVEKEKQQYFVGIVSQRDVFRQISPYLEKTGGIGAVESDRIALQQLLVQIVTRKPKSASPETPIQDIAKMMVPAFIKKILPRSYTCQPTDDNIGRR